VLQSKTKHIEVRYHFLRDNIEKRRITLIHVPTVNTKNWYRREADLWA
jgi:hypothetical protein